MKKKDRKHFGNADKTRRPFESLFRRLDFKPLVFGTFGEMSTNVKDVVNMAVEYGMEHLGRTMAATTVNGVRSTLRRRYKTQLSVAVWRCVCQLDHGHDQICGNKTLGSKQSSDPGRNAGKGRWRRV